MPLIITTRTQEGIKLTGACAKVTRRDPICDARRLADRPRQRWLLVRPDEGCKPSSTSSPATLNRYPCKRRQSTFGCNRIRGAARYAATARGWRPSKRPFLTHKCGSCLRNGCARLSQPASQPGSQNSPPRRQGLYGHGMSILWWDGFYSQINPNQEKG